jgi:hypothetical protein
MLIGPITDDKGNAPFTCCPSGGRQANNQNEKH